MATPFERVVRRNPLKTGLVLASIYDRREFYSHEDRESQSPENGSRPCKPIAPRAEAGRSGLSVAIP